MTMGLQQRQPKLDSSVATALEEWRLRLASAGVACRSTALHSPDQNLAQAFQDSAPELSEAWDSALAQVSSEKPVVVLRVGAGLGSDTLLAVALRLPGGPAVVVGALLPPPHSDRTLQLVLLSMGSLQLTLAAERLARSDRSTHLLELLGHVGSQTTARAAAQEWINRTAAWIREGDDGLSGGLMLSLFYVRGDLPKWWVSSDLSWAESASPEIRQAADLASQAMVHASEVTDGTWFAVPLLADGESVAMLVAKRDVADANTWSEASLALMRSAAAVSEPLLRQWLRAERGLLRHCLESALDSWRKLWAPGHLVWKTGAIVSVLSLCLLLLWPVPDRVTATTVIEGATRHVVTAPFDGFLAHVAVRPGARVQEGQLLARLDNRDLLLEQARFGSERDQATGRIREAMAERNAAAVALSTAEARQAQAQLALVESKLSRVDLRAPHAGLVVSGDWAQQLGSPVETGKELFEVATTDGYRVVLHVPDSEMARVQEGQLGGLRLTGQPHAVHEFKIVRVTALASVQDSVNGFRVEAQWLGTVPPLTPGMQGVSKVTVGQANLLTVWTRSSLNWLRLKWWAWWW
jgi:multidrug resistance efflux pump